MSENAIYAIVAGVVMTISTITPAIAQGITSKSAMDAIARQPDAAGNIRSTLIVSLALMEALAIYGLLIAFMLISNIK
jgi:F-type H+-transporting ATPase subunit c